jgi:hypothetical protein
MKMTMKDFSWKKNNNQSPKKPVFPLWRPCPLLQDAFFLSAPFSARRTSFLSLSSLRTFL